MSTNPFDDDQGSFFVLKNERGQYSLWPTFAAIPDGWEVVMGEANCGVDGGVPREDALAYIEEHWVAARVDEAGVS